MKPASDATNDPAHTDEAVPQRPTPTGDAFIDEVRQNKYNLSAQFDHDIRKLGEDLKNVQDDLAKQAPERIVRCPKPSHKV